MTRIRVTKRDYILKREVRKNISNYKRNTNAAEKHRETKGSREKSRNTIAPNLALKEGGQVQATTTR
jgi:hypothetical protein